MTNSALSPVSPKKVRPPNSPPPWWLRLVVTILLMVVLFGMSIGISLYMKELNTPEPTNFEECQRARGSKVQESYPPVCVTKDEKKFIKELSADEQKYLNPQSENKPQSGFCGGIAGIICSEGFTCRYDGNYPDASGTCVPN